MKRPLAPRTRGASGLFMALLGGPARLLVLVLLRLFLDLVRHARGSPTLGLLGAYRTTAATPASLALFARGLLSVLGFSPASVTVAVGRVLLTGDREILRLRAPVGARIAAGAALAARGSLKLGYCLVIGLSSCFLRSYFLRSGFLFQCLLLAACSRVRGLRPVSYTHLTLPTNREV